jgi:hypothetical protein
MTDTTPVRHPGLGEATDLSAGGRGGAAEQPGGSG